MNKQAGRSGNPSVITMLLTATGVVWTYLAIEWLIVSGFGYVPGQVAVARTLMGIGGAGLFIGAGVAVLSMAIYRWQGSSHIAIAGSFSLLIFIEMYSAFGSALPVAVKMVGASATGLLAFSFLARVFENSFDFIRQPGFWWSAAGFAFTLAIALSAVNSVDFTGTAIALGGAIVAALILFFGWRTANSGVLFPAMSLLTVLLACAVLGNRVPAYEPDVAAKSGSTNVLLVTIDTLRADHVGAYGYSGAKTPHLDGLASDGFLFREAVTASPLTGPSHTSIMSGLVPARHGVLKNNMRIPASVQTLAGILRGQGYVTGAFVSGYTVTDKSSGLPSRFHVFDDDLQATRWLPERASRIAVFDFVGKAVRILGWDGVASQLPYRTGRDTADIAIDWFASNTGHPYFVWVHLFDPHLPYHPPAKYLQQVNTGLNVTGEWYSLDSYQRSKIVNAPEKVLDMIRLYDAEIAYSDDQLGRIIAAARDAAPDDNLLTIVTSDHGESMGEHQLFWSRQLYDPTLLVPLIVVPPDAYGILSREISSQVSLIDVAPTILDLLGIEPAVEMDGVSFTGLLHGETQDSTGPAVSELFDVDHVVPSIRSVREDRWKLIYRYPGADGNAPLGKPVPELYNLHADPREAKNLVELGEGIPVHLQEIIDENIDSSHAPELALTPEERERLRSLGYVD